MNPLFLKPYKVTVAGLLIILLAGMTSCSSVNCCRPDNKPGPKAEDFVFLETASHGKKYPFWHTKSAGKPVLLLHALNGISPSTMDLALEMEEWGYRVYLPSLFGPDIFGEPPLGFTNGVQGGKYVNQSPDWDVSATDNAGPILNDIREMAKWVSDREGSEVIVFGNCLTGMFPLALINESHVSTVVLCQPATPLLKPMEALLRIPQKPDLAGAFGISASDLDAAITALQNNSTKRVIGFHFQNDPIASLTKFVELQKRFKAGQVADQFETYLLAPLRDSRATRHFAPEEWTVVGETRQHKRLLEPHSTVINPRSKIDRSWFRSHLRLALAR